MPEATESLPVAIEAPVEAPAPEVVEPKEPRTFTQEELERELGARVARQNRVAEKQLREERDARIRLEERLAAATPKVEEKPAGKPLLKDYQDFELYTEAVAEWTANKVAGTVLQKRQEADGKQAEQRQVAEQEGAWAKKVQIALKDLPDYHETVSGNTYPLPPAMRAFIMESDHGPALAYYLATHLTEANEIAASTPSGAARRLTRIEDGFKTNPVTKTPPPLNATGARQTSGVKTLSDAKSYDDFVKRRTEFRANKRAH